MKIRLHKSFLPVALYFLLSGGFEKFVMMCVMVFIHEMGHSFAAVLVGLKLEQILIMPIGQRAVVRDIYSVSAIKRIFIFVSGPFISIVLGGLFWVLNMKKMSYASLNIAFFNMLPFLPLDGGNILMAAIGNFIGDLKAAKIMLKISKVFSVFVLAFGFWKIILYPYNLDFVVAGLFMRMINSAMSASIYNRIIDEIFNPKHKTGSVRFIYSKKLSLIELLENMNTSKTNVVVTTNNNKTELFSQEEICDLILNEGRLF